MARNGSDSLQSAAIVVDPYSSGKYLLIVLESRGVPVIAVRSSTKMAKLFQGSHAANKRFFAEEIEFEDLQGLEDLVEAVKALPYNVMGVLPGSEPGVELANRLSDALGFAATNPLELLEARKDKAEMQEALRRKGVPAAEQFKSGCLEELLSWASTRNQWPLVAKPTGGAGSDGIFFCRTEEDLKVAYGGIIGNRNVTGALNRELALQEFLAGDEYIVDTVSYAGKHLCVAIWVYKKARGLPWNPYAIAPEEIRLLPPTGERQDVLVDYVFKVLDAVGLKYGPCHTEVMFTQRGPILVEVNARLHGVQGPYLIELCTGTSQATYAIDAVLYGGQLFHQLYQDEVQGRFLYPLAKQCVYVCLLSPVEGYLVTSLKQTIMDMGFASAVEVTPAVEKGGYLRRSKDVSTLAGIIALVHESMEQIHEDISRIREAETDMTLYQVAAEPPSADLGGA
eukprot:CAMPEP_0117529050 /NCGR_PEP_ID=MMETSP0784-20121206/37633_1 /TAXON_ID=39447 /ORGANISM="" /LENGTH=452 /DNA_ID=CAMNT_0005325361 /DNA_START=74 /DNA_END=1432 /DNA_ORIENTATION=-